MLNEIKRMCSEGYSLPKIAEKLGKSYSFIYKQVMENSIEYTDGRILYRQKTNESGERRLLSKEQEKEVIVLYKDGNSMKNISDVFNTTPATILSVLRRTGTPTRLKNGLEEHKPTKLSKEELYRLYHIENKSLSDIAKEYGYGYPSAVKFDMERLGIERRGYSEAGKNLHISRPELRWSIAEKNSESFGKFLQGRASSLEKNFIDWCITNDVKYKHQWQIPNCFLRHNYDFLLPDYNLIVEIDGDYWHLTEEAIVRDNFYDKVAKQNGYDIIRFLGSVIKETKGDCYNEIIRKYDR